MYLPPSTLPFKGRQSAIMPATSDLQREGSIRVRHLMRERSQMSRRRYSHWLDEHLTVESFLDQTVHACEHGVDLTDFMAEL